MNKNKIWEHMLQKGQLTNTQQQLQRQFKEAELNAPWRLCEMEDTWWSDLATEMQATVDKRNSKVQKIQ